MRLAAIHGQSWVTTGDRRREGTLGAAEGARIVAEQMARLEEVCLQLGRDPRSLRRLVLTGPMLDAGLASVEQFTDTVGRYGELGVTDFVVHWPRAEEPYAADLVTFERIFSALKS